MSSNKKKLIIFFILFLALSIPAGVYLVLREQELRGKAAPATTLAITPKDLTKTVGETFTLNIDINTGENTVSGAELHIQYDSSKLKAVSIDIAPTPFLPKVLIDGTVGGGFAFITLGSLPAEPKKGTGTLATITFTASSPTGGTPTVVRFTSDTRVAGTGEIGNVLVSTTPSSIIINPQSQAVTPTPSPSPTPTLTPKPGTPTPTTPVGGPQVITPTPLKVATISATPTATPAAQAPTVQPIPVTAEVSPTAVLTIGGLLLFLLGAFSLIAM